MKFILSAALAVLGLVSAAPSDTVFVKRAGATCSRKFRSNLVILLRLQC